MPEKIQREESGRVAAVFDFDGTLIHGDSTQFLLTFLARRHPYCLVEIMKIAFLAPACLMGITPRERVKDLVLCALARLPHDEWGSLLDAFHDLTLAPRYLEPAMATLQWHREQGHFLILASASLELYLDRVARHLGFDLLVCTQVTPGPRPSVKGRNCRGEEKVRRLSGVSVTGGINWAGSWAYSDSLSDLPLLRLSGQPVATNPTRSLRLHAERAGWPVREWARR